MRSLLSVLTVLGLSAAIALPAEAAKRSGCARAKTETIAKNKLVRVFERGPGSSGRGDFDSRLVGCLKASGKAVRLEDAYDDGYVTSYGYDDVRLAGRFVAWSSFYTDISCKAACPPDYDQTRSFIAVRDLRRQKRRSLPTDAAPSAVAVSKRGALAWAEPAGAGLDIHLVNSTGHHVVAQGVSDTTGFGIAGGTLTWRDGSGERSAPAGHY
jgi:hypothetical protein